MKPVDNGILIIVAVGLLGYLIGSFPTAFLVVRRFTGRSILELGSGNIGTLNTLRATNSKLLTLLSFVGDVGKGVLAMALGYTITNVAGDDVSVGITTGGLMAVVGHNYSVFLMFKGGKGIATSLPLLLYLTPLLIPLWIAVFFLAVLCTRLLVLGQILGTVAVPIGAVFLFPDKFVPVSILAAVVFIRHAPRIRNIVNRTEPKMYYKIRE